MSRVTPTIATARRDEALVQQHVRVDLVRRPGGVVVRPHGDLDVHAVPALLQTFADALDEGTETLVVDLAAVTFADSTVLGALVLAWKRATVAGAVVEFVGPSRDLRRLFEITGLDRVLEIRSGSPAVAEAGAPTIPRR